MRLIQPRPQKVCPHCRLPFEIGAQGYRQSRAQFDQRIYCGRACEAGARTAVRASTASARFEANVMPEPTSGCWLWLGTIQAGGGYGVFGKQYAHRFSYEISRGPIPDGREIDHLCRNRQCVNPAHLEAVDHRTNMLRGTAPSAVVYRAGTCRRGHPWTEESTQWRQNGSRYCRTCSRSLRWHTNYGRGARRRAPLKQPAW